MYNTLYSFETTFQRRVRGGGGVEKICSRKRVSSPVVDPSRERSSLSLSLFHRIRRSVFLSEAEVHTRVRAKVTQAIARSRSSYVWGTHTRWIRTVVQMMRRSGGEGVRVLLTLIGGSGLYYCVRRCRTRTHSHARCIPTHTHTHAHACRLMPGPSSYTHNIIWV